MSFLRPLWLALAWPLALAACASEEDARPPIGDCTESCNPSSSTNKPGSQAGAGGAGGAGGGGAGGGAGASGSSGQSTSGAKLDGTVVVFNDTTFSTTSLYLQPAVLSAKASDPSSPPSTGWQGSGTFTLSRVAIGASSWVKASPTQFGQTLSGILQLDVDATSNDAIEVPVVDTAVLASILGTQPGAPAVGVGVAHVVLTFVDASGVPLAGVTVSPSFPAIQLADSGPQFAEGPTGTRGQVLLLNASLTPNGAIAYEPPGATGPSSVNVVQFADTVTFARVVVP